jgi:hypothetical protein
MLASDIVKMMNLIRFFIKEYRQSNISRIFSSNRVWNTNVRKSVEELADVVMFEKWLIAYHILHPDSFEALESIIDVTFKEDTFDFRNYHFCDTCR